MLHLSHDYSIQVSSAYTHLQIFRFPIQTLQSLCNVMPYHKLAYSFIQVLFLVQQVFSDFHYFLLLLLLFETCTAGGGSSLFLRRMLKRTIKKKIKKLIEYLQFWTCLYLNFYFLPSNRVYLEVLQDDHLFLRYQHQVLKRSWKNYGSSLRFYYLIYLSYRYVI